MAAKYTFAFTYGGIIAALRFTKNFEVFKLGQPEEERQEDIPIIDLIYDENRKNEFDLDKNMHVVDYIKSIFPNTTLHRYAIVDTMPKNPKPQPSIPATMEALKAEKLYQHVNKENRDDVLQLLSDNIDYYDGIVVDKGEFNEDERRILSIIINAKPVIEIADDEPYPLFTNIFIKQEEQE